MSMPVVKCLVISKKRINDAKHVRKVLDTQEKVIDAKGEEIRRRFKQAEMEIKEREKSK